MIDGFDRQKTGNAKILLNIKTDPLAQLNPLQMYSLAASFGGTAVNAWNTTYNMVSLTGAAGADQSIYQSRNLVFYAPGLTQEIIGSIKFGSGSGSQRFGLYHFTTADLILKTGFWFENRNSVFYVCYQNEAADTLQEVSQNNFNIDPMLTGNNINGVVFDLTKNWQYSIRYQFDQGYIQYGVYQDGYYYPMHILSFSGNSSYNFLLYKNLPITCEGTGIYSSFFIGNLAAIQFGEQSLNKYVSTIGFFTADTVPTATERVLMVVRGVNSAYRNSNIKKISIHCNNEALIRIYYIYDVTEASLTLSPSPSWTNLNVTGSITYDLTSTTFSTSTNKLLIQSIFFPTDINSFDIDTSLYPTNGWQFPSSKNSYFIITAYQVSGSDKTYACQLTLEEDF